MLQIDQLVCLVNRPAATSEALQHAVHFAAVHGAMGPQDMPLHVLVSGAGTPSGVEEAVREWAEAFGARISLSTHSLSGGREAGAVWAVLRRSADDTDATLVVIDPPEGRGSLPPIADREIQSLFTELSCSIFVVGKATPPDAINHILVPTDLSDESVYALRHATALATGYEASISLLHVIETSPYVALTPVDRLSLGSTTLTEHRARRRLRQFPEEGRPPEVQIHTHIAFGEPADRIAQHVSDRRVDLLVLASHGAGKSRERPLGPVANRVLRRVACPTFFVRAGDRSLLADRPDADSAVEGEPDG